MAYTFTQNGKTKPAKLNDQNDSLTLGMIETE